MYWAKNGQNDHFGQNDLIPPNRTLVHFGLKRSILVHLGPPTELWPLPNGESQLIDSSVQRFLVSRMYRADEIPVSEMASAKMASAIGVRIDDVGSILKFRIGFPFGENSAFFCQSVWLPGSILNFRIGSVSSIGGLIAATMFADTVSDS